MGTSCDLKNIYSLDIILQYTIVKTTEFITEKNLIKMWSVLKEKK